jgi:bifunctional non-homologous end joining protein LigD
MATSKPAAKKKTHKATEDKVETPASLVDAQLARYRSMRDFGVTAEPAGSPAADTQPGLPFVVQKHAASHLHYDFRLGWNGVLKSWACAKGPSYVVADKRLAVEVEDHPIDYGGFEGIIPAGQYGGGTVMVWDQGTWEPQLGHDDVDAALSRGELKFILHGTKLEGNWALIRMHERKPAADGSGPKSRWGNSTKPNWLLIKEHDSFERPPQAPAITEERPNSAITGRSLDQIASNEDHVWNSNRDDKSKSVLGKPPHAPKAATRPAKAKPAAPRIGDVLDLASLPKELQPGFLKPQLADEVESPPDTSDWLHELKLDGYRIQARKQGAKVQLLTRSGLDWTHRAQAVAAEVSKLPCSDVTLDGEVVVLAADGTSNFADLQASFQEGARNPLTYFPFDLLHVDGHNPRGLPLIERKALLAKVLAHADPSALQISEHLETSGPLMFRKACELHAEGIISKRANAPYRAGRSADWVKSKCLHEQEFVVIGYTLPGKSRSGGPGIGSLLLAYYESNGKTLTYAGRTGTGFTQRFAATLRKRLETLEQLESPLGHVSSEARKDAIWVRPELVAQVRFATWTADNQLRQAAFLGLREDKPAGEVRREIAAPTPKSNANKSSRTGAAGRPEKAAAGGKPVALERSTVRLTHPGKMLDPGTRLTKQQLADFYWTVSGRMLPHIAGRALSLVRLPAGIGGESFYQKHVTSALPKGFEAVEVPDKKTGKVDQYVSLATPEAIASLAQMSVLEVHPWGSLASDLEHPDRLVIDLDPDEALPWPVLASAATDVRARLKALGLESFLKTTGGKGLHVVIPIAPQLAWPEIKLWCHGFVKLMERDNPSLYLSKMTKAARKGKIYLDYLRNERGATAVAPYSPRARPDPGVAVPLEWKELGTPERPNFRISNFAEWSHRLRRDPWEKMKTLPQPISAEARQACGLR